MNASPSPIRQFPAKLTTWPYVRRQLRHLALDVIDSGFLGLQPLEMHAVICGFPRSGSTLLLLMAEACFTSAKTFHREKCALAAARTLWRNHQLMISKNPNDIFWLEEIDKFYGRRPADVRFILTVRDPRAVLTSIHEKRPGYYYSVEEWCQMFACFQKVRSRDDVLIVKFEELILNPRGVQDRFSAFVGRQPERRFDEFYTKVPRQFDTQPLNGVRPLDPCTIDRWRRPEHRERIRAVLRELPALADILITLEYETDRAWLSECQ